MDTRSEADHNDDGANDTMDDVDDGGGSVQLEGGPSERARTNTPGNEGSLDLLLNAAREADLTTEMEMEAEKQKHLAKTERLKGLKRKRGNEEVDSASGVDDSRGNSDPESKHQHGSFSKHPRVPRTKSISITPIPAISTSQDQSPSPPISTLTLTSKQIRKPPNNNRRNQSEHPTSTSVSTSTSTSVPTSNPTRKPNQVKRSQKPPALSPPASPNSNSNPLPNPPNPKRRRQRKPKDGGDKPSPAIVSGQLVKNQTGRRKGKSILPPKKGNFGKLELIKDLPLEILGEIISHLPPSGLLYLSRTCKWFRTFLLGPSSIPKNTRTNPSASSIRFISTSTGTASSTSTSSNNPNRSLENLNLPNSNFRFSPSLDPGSPLTPLTPLTPQSIPEPDDNHSDSDTPNSDPTPYNPNPYLNLDSDVPNNNTNLPSTSNSTFNKQGLSIHAEQLWAQSFENVGLPTRPEDLTWEEYARLIFEKECQHCGIPRIQKTDFGFRKRLCDHCLRTETVIRIKVPLEYKHLPDIEEVLPLIPYTHLSFNSSDRTRSQRYYRPTLLAMYKRVNRMRNEVLGFPTKIRTTPPSKRQKKSMLRVEEEVVALEGDRERGMDADEGEEQLTNNISLQNEREQMVYSTSEASASERISDGDEGLAGENENGNRDNEDSTDANGSDGWDGDSSEDDMMDLEYGGGGKSRGNLQEVERFKKERRQWSEQARQHGDECSIWKSNEDQKRLGGVLDTRTQRREDIASRLRLLGWEQSDIDHPQVTKSTLVNQPRLLTERIWVNIKPKLIPLLEQVKSERLEAKRQERRRCRWEAFKFRYEEFVKLQESQINSKDLLRPSEIGTTLNDGGKGKGVDSWDPKGKGKGKETTGHLDRVSLFEVDGFSTKSGIESDGEENALEGHFPNAMDVFAHNSMSEVREWIERWKGIDDPADDEGDGRAATGGLPVASSSAIALPPPIPDGNEEDDDHKRYRKFLPIEEFVANAEMIWKGIRRWREAVMKDLAMVHTGGQDDGSGEANSYNLNLSEDTRRPILPYHKRLTFIFHPPDASNFPQFFPSLLSYTSKELRWAFDGTLPPWVSETERHKYENAGVQVPNFMLDSMKIERLNEWYGTETIKRHDFAIGTVKRMIGMIAGAAKKKRERGGIFQSLVDLENLTEEIARDKDLDMFKWICEGCFWEEDVPSEEKPVTHVWKEMLWHACVFHDSTSSPNLSLIPPPDWSLDQVLDFGMCLDDIKDNVEMPFPFLSTADDFPLFSSDWIDSFSQNQIQTEAQSDVLESASSNSAPILPGTLLLLGYLALPEFRTSSSDCDKVFVCNICENMTGADLQDLGSDLVRGKRYNWLNWCCHLKQVHKTCTPPTYSSIGLVCTERNFWAPHTKRKAVLNKAKQVVAEYRKNGEKWMDLHLISSRRKQGQQEIEGISFSL